MDNKQTQNTNDRRNSSIDDRRSSNVVWCNTEVTKEKRNQLNQQQSAILWFTGLSGSGKSTIADAVEERLHNSSVRTYILDGDNVRHGLNGDLGFSDEDRQENIRRIGETSKLFIDAGVMVLTSFISPFVKDRDFVRQNVKTHEFIEIHVQCPLEVCEERDIKGLYEKARKGEITQFTGIDSPYEEPESAEIVIDTSALSIEESANKIVEYLSENSYIQLNSYEDIVPNLLRTVKKQESPA